MIKTKKKQHSESCVGHKLRQGCRGEVSEQRAGGDRRQARESYTAERGNEAACVMEGKTEPLKEGERGRPELKWWRQRARRPSRESKGEEEREREREGGGIGLSWSVARVEREAGF